MVRQHVNPLSRFFQQPLQLPPPPPELLQLRHKN